MPTLEEVRTRVERIVHDISYHGDVADDYINNALRRCAGFVLLPDLESSGNITTSSTASAVAIPLSWNFDRNLYLCSAVVEQPSKIKVLSSIALLAREYPDYRLNVAQGNIEACSASRTAFAYYKTPTEAVVLRCAFYKKPTLLVRDADEPSILPDFLHYDLLVSGACAAIFTEIEEGIDGIMVNTNKYSKKFDKAIEDLKDYFKTGQSRPEPSRASSFI